MIPNSFKLQDGCYNCFYRFVRTEYDQCSEYFCIFYGLIRPLCGSVAMKECFCFDDEDFWSKQSSQWDEWVKNHKVEMYGICDNWVKK